MRVTRRQLEPISEGLICRPGLLVNGWAGSITAVAYGCDSPPPTAGGCRKRDRKRTERLRCAADQAVLPTRGQVTNFVRSQPVVWDLVSVFATRTGIVDRSIGFAQR